MAMKLLVQKPPTVTNVTFMRRQLRQVLLRVTIVNMIGDMMERTVEALTKDLNDIGRVVENIQEHMGERYSEKWNERGSYKEATCEEILENLSRNVMQLANAVHNKRHDEMGDQVADIFNLTAMVILRVDECYGS